MTRCVCTFGWCVPCRERMANEELFHPQQLAVILFRLAFVRFSTTEAYTSTLRCCSGRNWSKFGGTGTRNEIKTNPQLTNCKFALHLRTATAPHKQLQPAKLRGAPDGVCESVGCTRQQSVVGSQKRLRRCFPELEVASQQHKNSQNRKKTTVHARDPITGGHSNQDPRCTPKTIYTTMFTQHIRS